MHGAQTTIACLLEPRFFLTRKARILALIVVVRTRARVRADFDCAAICRFFRPETPPDHRLPLFWRSVAWFPVPSSLGVLAECTTILYAGRHIQQVSWRNSRYCSFSLQWMCIALKNAVSFSHRFDVLIDLDHVNLLLSPSDLWAASGPHCGDQRQKRRSRYISRAWPSSTAEQ